MSREIDCEFLVVGAGVSGLTAAYDLSRAGREVYLIDKGESVGGCAQTLRQEGYLFETGPFNLLVRDPAFEDLLSDLSGALEVVSPSSEASRRDLLFRGELRELPGSLLEAITTPLLSFPQKMRLAAEPLLGKKTDDPDPTLGEMFTRRFGRGFAENILSAAVVGIFGGDSDRLSAKSCFRFFWEIDRSSRSFIVGGVKRRLTSRMNTRKWKGMVSFSEGLGSFCNALAAPLGDRLRTSTTLESIDAQEGEGYVVHAIDPEGPVRFRAKRLVLGLDLPAAQKALEPFASDLVSELAEIESVSLAVVNLGFRKEAFEEVPKGFGFLVPKTEAGVNILGTLWASNVFPHQAPDGCLSVRVFVGGVRSPEWVDLSEDELANKALRELGQFVEIREAPQTYSVSRYKQAVPQMVPGFSDRIERVESGLENHPNLSLVGNYLHGVSVNDCVVHARKTAARLVGTE